MSESSSQPLTVTEYAAANRVSAAVIYRLVRNGQLKAIRFGKQIRIPADAIPSGDPA